MSNQSTDVNSDGPRLVSREAELRRAIADLRETRKRVGLVPTMGALHEGHLSLVRASRKECDGTIVTVFVNPAQFGPHEDLADYPRTLTDDLEALAEYGVDVVFAPPASEIYPEGCSTWVDPPRVAQPLEGICRPGHFRGVTTVVLKLFNLAAADVAYFGQKDYQQYLVIRRMVEDLNVPIAIRMCPIVRETDGLAMSSRNQYIGSDQRHQAIALSQSLQQARQLVDEGIRESSEILARMREILVVAGITRVDYVAVCDPQTLKDISRVERPAIALVAAFVGTTRLIDNCLLE